MNLELNPGDEAPLQPKPIEGGNPNGSLYNYNLNASPKKIARRTRPWFESGLPIEFRGPKAPNKLIKFRNFAIVALSIQVASVLAGFACFALQRNRVYLIINIISVVFLINGWYGVIFLSRWNSAVHGVLTSAILGVFFLFCLLEAFAREDLSQGGELRYSDRGVLLLFSIPYLVDFFAGLVTFYLTFLLFKEQERQDADKAKLEHEEPEIELPADYDESSNFCCICMDKEKNTVIYPCGHRALCLECSQVLKSRNNKKCPICRSIVKDIIPIYS